jgi:hypothetical protein
LNNHKEKKMNDLVLYEPANQPNKSKFQKALDDCIKWSGEHQAEIGVVEMALGASIIYFGVQSGAIQIGTDLVGSKLTEIGGSISAAFGGVATPLLAATFLKSIFVGGVTGVAGVTMIPAIPVLALVGGGALIFGSFGYAATDLAAKFIDKFTEPSLAEYATGASIVGIGIALMIDGARRMIKDERVLKAASNFKDGVISLSNSSTEIVVKSWDELQSIVAELSKSPTASAGTAATAAAGAVVGGGLAAGSVTVLGSHALGAAALSVGLISAPVWPIIAGGAAGLALGVAAWKGIKHYKGRPNEGASALLPNPKND